MDIINDGALVLLVARVIAVIAILLYVVPITIRELRRKQQSSILYALRWVLFILIVLYVVPSIFPIWSGLQRITEPPISVASTVASYWQGVRELAIAAMIIAIYALSGILSRKR